MILENKLKTYIDFWLNGEKLKNMRKSHDYYLGKQDILNRKKQTIDPNGDLVNIENVPNYKIVDNQFKGLLDQKTNYILTKPITLSGDNDIYIDKLNEFLNDKFLKTLFLLCKDSYKFGISWLYVFINEKGELTFKKFDSREIIPIWRDNEHTDLEAVIRVYKDTEVIEDKYNEVLRVEFYNEDGITFYNYKNGLEKVEEKSYFYNSVQKKWGKLPIIPFKANDDEQPLLNRVKSIQDSINEVLSDFKNDMEQNWRNTVFVVKGYNPEGSKFRHNLNLYGVVGIDGDGDVDTLSIEVNSENYKSILNLLRKAMIENGKGFDSKNDMLGSNPNQMNIQSMYSDIDLDANALEREFQYSLQEVISLINEYLLITKQGNFLNDKAQIIFNRDIMINESQSIADCLTSSSILSKESILSQHPWVTDVDLELKRLEEQENYFTEEHDHEEKGNVLEHEEKQEQE